ncbi:DNA polymerase IV [Rubritalea marina]|uniref:DNA polymerase IV n=1 Tax=Rubritalea marina TaxID=361055 RepID=UPI0003A6958B|nr:DNA polymerase IV [Rubritalea marina]
MNDWLDSRKIIHIDMDCFYAAVEQRDHPEWRDKPIGVGGGSRRGVLCTASYEARAYGVHSAMPGFMALQKCPQIILVPLRMEVYQSVSAQVRAIFGRFTDLIEPLSLDEAYLDVSHWESDPNSIAREIRHQIYEETRLTASAGIGPNKLIAKVASDRNKPNGQYTVTPVEVDAFMRDLPVKDLWGVGEKMQQKFSQQGVKCCGDLQKVDKVTMAKRYGKWGLDLYQLCRGIDERPVRERSSRKSISKETTFSSDATDALALLPELRRLAEEVEVVYRQRYTERNIKSLVVKLKFADFTQTTVERAASTIDSHLLDVLLEEGFARAGAKGVRLLGVGVKLADEEEVRQLEMF